MTDLNTINGLNGYLFHYLSMGWLIRIKHNNFCNSCKAVLANEDSQIISTDAAPGSADGKDVWFLKIRDYADKLLEGLDEVDYLPRIRISRNR